MFANKKHSALYVSIFVFGILFTKSFARDWAKGPAGFSEILGIFGIIEGSVTGTNLRHPASGGKCLDISGASPLEWALAILYDCKRTLGLVPVNQRFSFEEGKNDNILIKAAFSSINRCLTAPRRDGDRKVYSVSCDRNVDDMNFRIQQVDDSRFMIQHVVSSQCIAVDDNSIKLSDCDTSNKWTHWVLCNGNDGNCGK